MTFNTSKKLDTLDMLGESRPAGSVAIRLAARSDDAAGPRWNNIRAVVDLRYGRICHRRRPSGGRRCLQLPRPRDRAPGLRPAGFSPVARKTLFIGSSHSGNTEETLDSFATALKAGVQSVGRSVPEENLLNAAKEQNIPLWTFRHAGQPRGGRVFVWVAARTVRAVEAHSRSREGTGRRRSCNEGHPGGPGCTPISLLPRTRPNVMPRPAHGSLGNCLRSRIIGPVARRIKSVEYSTGPPRPPPISNIFRGQPQYTGRHALPGERSRRTP